MIGGFLVWHVIGANSSDDGYILQMARVAGHAGYMSNYFRWFGSPEDPFGWYYNLLALMTGVSDASIWMRLPDLVCGIVCWLLLSREVLPRLGPAVAASKPAVWAAGLVLLAAWMPFNNGLRPEGQIATGALITYVLIERAIISGRMTPAALAILTAAFTLGIQPTGLIAVAALLAGGRPILRILVQRHRIVGTWPLVAPLLAAGTVVLTVVFADQTFATVLEATRIRTAIGPSQAWYTENLRYYYLILPTVDGSLSRRFGFLITALSLFTSMFIMLRRKRVPGVARGPVWRLMGVIFGTMFFLMFTPTKWVHHFGLFAAVGAAMAAVATVLVSPAVMRWSRNRMAFLAAVFFTAGAVLRHHQRLVVRVELRRAVQQRDAEDRRNHRQLPLLHRCSRSRRCGRSWLHFADRATGQDPVARALTAAPIPMAAGFMVVVFVGSMVAGIVRQYPTYSNGWANLRAFTGGCGLADDVLVEPDANDGFLTPLPGNYGPLGPLGGVGPVGFTPNSVPEKIVAETIRMNLPMPGTDYDWDQPTKLKTPGVNGSTVPLPYGLDPARVPLAGTYVEGPQQQSRLTSAWYQLPRPDDAHPLVVITAAGTITGDSVFNGRTDGQKVELEYARPGPDGAPVPAGRLVPYDLGPIPSWRNLRFPRVGDSGRRGRGAGGRRGSVADAGRLDRRHPAARARAAVGAGVRRLGSARADGLGCRPCLPVPAADAARQRRHRDSEVPDHPRLQRQAQGHRHLGGRTQRRPAGHHRPAVAGARDGDVSVERLGPRLGVAAQVRHHRGCPARAARLRHRHAQRAVEPRQDPHRAVNG